MFVFVKQSDFHYQFVFNHESVSETTQPAPGAFFLGVWSILITRSANSQQLKPET